jgi:two-component system sensor histidine kinase MprB
MTLRWRIALMLATVALVVGAFAALASYFTTSSELRGGIDDTLRSRAAAVNVPSGGPADRGPGGRRGPNDAEGSACPDAGVFQPASAAQLVATNGTVTACIKGGPVLSITDHDRSLAAGGIDLRTVTIAGERYRVLATPWHDGGTLQIARSLGESDALLRRLRLQLFGLVAGGIVLAAVLGWAVATRLARPITRLRDAAHRIATTLDLSAPVDVSGSGEVGSLAASFSTMVQAVARSQEQQRQLVSDASHEMRTPLTSLRSNVELLGQIDRLPREEREDVVTDVLEDVDELALLLAELVDLASDLTEAEPTELVALGDLARAVAERAERRSDRSPSVSDDGSEVQARPRQLERAVSNLVDNAIKYSERDTPIEIGIAAGTLVVRDRGPGIPVGDLDRVFDRFYRAVDVRTQPGSGLGLAIVQQIVSGHGGHVFARNREGGGAEVGFTLPADLDRDRDRSDSS